MANLWEDLKSLDGINKDVQEGKIIGSTLWPSTGIAELKSVGLKEVNGNTYLEWTLSKTPEGMNKFLMKLPKPEDKPQVKFYSMQCFYRTLFSVANLSPDRNDFAIVLQVASEQGVGKKYKYSLSEFETVSVKTGQVYKNQRIESLQLHVEQEQPTINEEMPF